MKRKNTPSAVPSPCNAVCNLDEETGYCQGCLRTLKEITDWEYLSDAEKKAVLAKLATRAAENPQLSNRT